MPQIKMRPLEDLHIPLAEIEQADHTHDIQRLHRKQTDEDADHAVFPGRRESEHGGNKNNGCLNAVASRLDGNREAVGSALNNLAESGNVRIDEIDQAGTNTHQRCSPREHDGALYGLRQLGRKQRDQDYGEENGEAQHK
ncbi:hypothetical protein NTG1052_660002 [Candidatus Nitrotoga sp. 1052]|nr:hypothetical protein NTG1052_660002 [Candidatus Nitrotoga sp. 1052]